MQDTVIKYKAQDFKSNQEIRWCAGCGDIAIISSIQKAMADMGRKKEDFAVISGIGCSSRFPYYMNTYGFHGIHGRAAAIASGVKTANPKLSVWQITGDGDAMAIGGNHFIHEIRRNIDINIVLFNNQIYGLTKGQYSPTSEYGKITKTSPYGTIEHPFNPGELIIGAQGKFFARGIDSNMRLNTEIFKIAHEHKGASLVEILQNCVIFNNGTFSYISDRATRDDRQIIVEHGKPLIFGKNRNKGIILVGLKLRVAEIGKNGITEEDILVHNAHDPDPTLHLALANMKAPDFPVAFGVIRNVEANTYDSMIEKQIDEVKSQSNIKCMTDLLNSGNTWTVE